MSYPRGVVNGFRKGGRFHFSRFWTWFVDRPAGFGYNPGGRTCLFEVEELYVKPERRNSGVGSRLFEYAENALRGEAEFLMLSTAVKN